MGYVYIKSFVISMSQAYELRRLRTRLMYMQNSLARNERRMTPAGIIRLTSAIRSTQQRIDYLSGYRNVGRGRRVAGTAMERIVNSYRRGK